MSWNGLEYLKHFLDVKATVCYSSLSSESLPTSRKCFRSSKPNCFVMIFLCKNHLRCFLTCGRIAAELFLEWFVTNLGDLCGVKVQSPLVVRHHCIDGYGEMWFQICISGRWSWQLKNLI